MVCGRRVTAIESDGLGDFTEAENVGEDVGKLS